MPIFNPNGNEVSEIILPDGSTASEVIAPDGSTVFSAIPDSVVLLDDFADGDLTTNRQTFNELAFDSAESTLVDQGQGGSLSRPDWTVNNGNPSVSNSDLSVGNNDRLRTPVSLSSLDNVTWEMQVDSATQFSYYSLTSTSSTYRDGDKNLQDGYYLIYEDGNGLVLYVDSAGSTTQLINPNDDSLPQTVRVERDDAGNWELSYDGVSKGTATDSTHTTSDRVAFSGFNGSLDVGFVAIDDGS
jgi:hypothetical protein